VSHRHPSAGFTLIEVLVALASISVLVVGAAALLTAASMAMRSARTGTTATLLALQKIEQLGASQTVPSGTIAQDYLAADGTPVAAASAFFIRRWTITPSWASTSNAAVTVEVFVSGANRVADVQGVIGGGGAS